MSLNNESRWKIPEHTKKEINKAGDIIRNNTASQLEQKKALGVIDNWRSAHAYPLHVFYMNLRRMAGKREDILVAERLKRMDSIVGKLQREKNMQLYRMQDLGGCRMVLPTLYETCLYSNMLKKSRIRHELIKADDYIQNPKRSGYRSLHLVYKFRTETAEKNIFNDYPMLIELQFRTHLQHIWATALETIGLFTNQALKSGQGNENILRFFVVVSSLFAIKENCPVVPNTLNDEKELISEMEILNEENHILDMLVGIRTVLVHDINKVPDKKGYFILQLDYKNRTLYRRYFSPGDFKKANDEYDYLEQHRDNAQLDIVMVSASSCSAVKAAYPNYFMDIEEFVRILSNFMND